MPTAEPDVRATFHALKDAVERRTATPDVSALQARIRARRRTRVAVPVMAAVVSSALVLTVLVGASIGNHGDGGEVSVAPAITSSGPTPPTDLRTPSPDVSPTTAPPEAGPTRAGSASVDPAATRRATPTRRTPAAGTPSMLPLPDPHLTNADFETVPVTADGQTTTGEASGWSGGYGTYNPDTVNYPNQSAAGITGTMSGPTVCYLTLGSAVSQQTRSAAQPGYVYRLTVAIGARRGAAFAPTEVVITAGGAPVAFTPVLTAPVFGDFADVSVEWTPTAADAGKLVGVSVVDTSPTAAVVDLDNVRLTVRPAPVASIPVVAAAVTTVPSPAATH